MDKMIGVYVCVLVQLGGFLAYKRKNDPAKTQIRTFGKLPTIWFQLMSAHFNTLSNA